MKIILTGVISGLADGEQKAFEQTQISLGRDPGECDVVFTNDRFPMVSRRHAAITFEADDWYLSDQNSTYGTFLNGQRVTRVRLEAGNVVQLGANGPSVGVFSLDGASIPATASVRVENQARSDPPAEIRFPGGQRLNAIPVAHGEITFGRDPASTVPFTSADAMVSRNHAAVIRRNDGFFVEDRGSFNGTFLNEQRITAAAPLTHGDRIRFGTGGPVAEFFAPAIHSIFGNSLANERIAHLTQNAANVQHFANDGKTVVARLGQPAGSSKSIDADPQLLMSVSFGDRQELKIGRAAESDIRLDGLDISSRHARLRLSGGQVSIEDLDSTNGVYVNGAPVTNSLLTPNDNAQIGPFSIKIDTAGTVGVFDTRARMRIDVAHLSRVVQIKGGRSELLNDISLTVLPNEFVGIIGPSGSGKTSLMNAMSGLVRPNAGTVSVNGRDLYRELASLRHSIGLVPQDDIIHRELTVYRTLLFVAKLRLSRDVGRKDIDRAINEVLDVTGLLSRRDVLVSDLSGGQRKRVSVAVELITRPSLLFLDEPTSGLDPQTEFSMMDLFRQIAASGRTVILTTHAAETVRMFDKVAILLQGRLAYFGTPDSALKAFGVADIRALFDRLESPENGSGESAAEAFRQAYIASPDFRKYVEEPQSQPAIRGSDRRIRRTRLGVSGSIRQWATLSRRYFEVLLRDKLNIALLIAEAPIVALLTLAAVNPTGPRDFIYFMLSIVAIWFGTSIAASEIASERPIYERERMVNLGILPYVASKFTVLGILVAFQCALLFLPLKIADLVSPGTMPGEFFGIPQFWAVILSAAVGLSIGLFISATVRTSQMATTLVPLVLIPQILLSGIFGVPNNISRPLSMAIPAAWSYDTMKRFSTLSTLEPEGAVPADATSGRGLYKQVEEENDAILEKARRDLDEYQTKTETKLRQYDDDRNAGLSPPRPDLDEMPAVPNARRIPADLSGYVTFLHPWMNEVLNQLVLMLMFSILAIATLVVLRIKDIR